MRNQGLPRWLMVLLALVAVVVLGPPVLGFLLGLAGLVVGLAAVLLKLGVIALAIFLVVAMFRAILGGASRPTDRGGDSLARLERLDSSKRSLDEELERAVSATRR
ncbi:MAG: hypothetical protein IT380_26000 [Myxococcales bacterium]|nr:hypothetical protein [Myxococcales bacterium]